MSSALGLVHSVRQCIRLLESPGFLIIIITPPPLHHPASANLARTCGVQPYQRGQIAFGVLIHLWGGCPFSPPVTTVLAGR